MGGSFLSTIITRVMRAVIALIAVCLAGTFAERAPKLLFVSRTTSTSLSVTTSFSPGLATCLMQTAGKITAACTTRKKRSVLVDDDIIKLEKIPLAIEGISRASRGIDETGLESVHSSMEGAKREPKFAWYYMTTTLTTTSFSTSVSTTYTGTLTLSIQKCTPSSYLACG